MVAKLIALGVKELLTLDRPPKQWHVEGLLPVGTIALLSAREKSGKGLFSIDLAASIAEGQPFLGLETIQGNAVYLAGEESIDLLQERVEARLGDNQSAPFSVVHLDGSTDGTLNLTREPDAEALEEFVQENDVDFLVLDVLRELHSAQEDSSTEMGPVMKRLRTIAHNNRCTIVVTHHDSKNGGSRGSTAIAGGVDVVLHMSTDSESELLKGSITAQGRGVPSIELAVRCASNGRWEGNIEKGSKPVLKLTVFDQVVRALLEAEESLNVNEITTRTHMNRQTVSNTMTKIKQDHPSLLKETTGQGTGVPHSYLINKEHLPPSYALPK